jgi:hypothetical protein
MNLNKTINEIIQILTFILIAVAVYCLLWSLDKPLEFAEFVNNVANGFAGNSVHVLFVNIGWLFVGYALVTLVSYIYHKITTK